MHVRRGGTWGLTSIATAATAMVGTVPAGVTPFMQAGTVAVAMDSAGNGTITFPVPFPNALISVNLTDASHTGALTGARIIGIIGASASTTLATARFAVRTDAGAGVVSQSMSVSYTAVGC